MNKTYIFFRNDDVKDILDRSLVQITKLFIDKNIPLTHAVEPANLTEKVVKWLLQTKQETALVDIMQHGFDHKIKVDYKKGEFGKGRTFEDQYEEILKGKKLMDKAFGNNWINAFSFPFGTYDENSMLALSKCGFKIVTGNYGKGLKRKIFYAAGHFLNKEMLFGYRVPYNLKYRPKSKLFQVNTNISPIDKYIDDKENCIMLSIDELIKQTRENSKNKAIGVVLHHRYHKSDEKLMLISNYLDWLKTQSYIEPISINGLYNQFK